MISLNLSAALPAIIAVLFLSGCQPSAGSATAAAPAASPSASPAAANATPLTTPDAADPITIGVILFSNDNFFGDAAIGMEEAADETGAEIQFRFHQDSAELEAKWIGEFTQANVDAILISPRLSNPNGSLPALAAAHEAGIKIICYNSCITGDAQNRYISSIVETDQYALGYEAGYYLAGWLKQRGIINPTLGMLQCCLERNKGFRQALADNGTVWQETAGMDAYLAEPAMAAAESILQDNPGINILWAESEGATIGAVTAVRALNLPQPVYVFGVDISPEIAQMLLADDDILQAAAAQSPRLMGQLAVRAALDAVENNINAGYIVVPGAFYSRDNPDVIKAYLQAP